MEFRNLDLTILSANDLKHSKFFSKMDVYVVVSILDSSYNLNSTLLKQKTPVDKDGGKNPTWNYPITFTVNDVALQQNQITVVFQIYSKRFFPVDKLIGEVRVPVSSLLSGGDDRKQQANTFSYQVRKSSGTPKGVLNFTCKVGEKFERAGPTVNSSGPTTAYPYAPPPQQPPMWGQPVSGYPRPPQQTGYGYGYPGYGNGYYGHGHGYGHAHGQRMGGIGGMGGGRNNFGMGLGAGLLGGALGGMLIGDMMSDAAHDGGFDNGAFDDGGFDNGAFDDGGFDGGGFDF